MRSKWQKKRAFVKNARFFLADDWRRRSGFVDVSLRDVARAPRIFCSWGRWPRSRLRTSLRTIFWLGTGFV